MSDVEVIVEVEDHNAWFRCIAFDTAGGEVAVEEVVFEFRPSQR